MCSEPVVRCISLFRRFRVCEKLEKERTKRMDTKVKYNNTRMPKSQYAMLLVIVPVLAILRSVLKIWHGEQNECDKTDESANKDTDYKLHHNIGINSFLCVWGKVVWRKSNWIHQAQALRHRRRRDVYNTFNSEPFAFNGKILNLCGRQQPQYGVFAAGWTQKALSLSIDRISLRLML